MSDPIPTTAPPRDRTKSSENSKAKHDRNYERSCGIWRNLFGGSRRKIAKKIAKNKRLLCQQLTTRSRRTPHDTPPTPSCRHQLSPIARAAPSSRLHNLGGRRMNPGMTRRTSLFRFRTPSPDSQFGNLIRRPETDAQNAAEIARQRESWVAKTRCEPAKWRQLRHNFLGGDMANRDVTVWLG